jgi:hypothetical protein
MATRIQRPASQKPRRKRTEFDKPFHKMTDSERARFVEAIEDGSAFRDAKPLDKKGKLLWKMAKRGRGRPRKAEHDKAIHVGLTMNPALLREADLYAKRHNMTRARLVDVAVRSMIRSGDRA